MVRKGINIISSKIFSTLNLDQFVWIYDLVAIVKSLLRDLFDLIGSLKEFSDPIGYNCDPLSPRCVRRPQGFFTAILNHKWHFAARRRFGSEIFWEIKIKISNTHDFCQFRKAH